MLKAVRAGTAYGIFTEMDKEQRVFLKKEFIETLAKERLVQKDLLKAILTSVVHHAPYIKENMLIDITRVVYAFAAEKK